MKITEAYIRGFDCFFTIQLRRKEYLTLDEMTAWVQKEITDTANIVHIKYLGSGDESPIKNPNYKETGAINTDISSKYINKHD
jgi:hypothetical protein